MSTPPSTERSSRHPTPIDRIADTYVERLLRLDPSLATYLGLSGPQSRVGDFSPEGRDARANLALDTLRELRAASPVDRIDAVTRTDLGDRLASELALHEVGAHLRDVNVVASPVQELRAVFDLMPTNTIEDWDVIAARLASVELGIEGYVRTLRQGIATGIVPDRRNVLAAATQIQRNVTEHGAFATLLANAETSRAGLPAALISTLARNTATAQRAFAGLATFLADELAPHAATDGGVGRDLYALHLRHFLGTDVDLDQTYEWGLAEMQGMVTRQQRAVDALHLADSIPATFAALDRDPAYTVHGAAALQRWMQEISDTAVADLAGTHFDIPTQARDLECKIAPTHDGGIYYTRASTDWSRPGRMWWSVPQGIDSFSTWRELPLIYHEGVPGHHLQMSAATLSESTTNAWRRQLAGTSGHSEGWALYAEQLMDELGYLQDPAHHLGMLDRQRMRVARVVIDLGVHLRKPRPDGHGTWDYTFALNYLHQNSTIPRPVAEYEVTRYLGWPGQAPSYRIGQRVWEQVRDHTRHQQGAAFRLKDFHARALDLGGVGLDTLRHTLADVPADRDRA